MKVAKYNYIELCTDGYTSENLNIELEEKDMKAKYIRSWTDVSRKNIEKQYVEFENEDMKQKKYLFIKYDYNKTIDTPIVGEFKDFSDIEDEMLELIMDKTSNIKLYFCDDIKQLDDDNKTLAGSFEEPKKFFNKTFKDEYKEFQKKYKLLLT